MNVQPTRNIFFSYDHDDQMRPIAPCIIYTITDEIRSADAERQAARKVVITWQPRLSDPAQKSRPKAHTPSKDPRKPSAPKRHRPCKHCATGTISRCNKKEICADCRKKAIADRYAEYVNARKRTSAPEPSKPKRQYVSRKRNPTPTREQLREQWRANSARRFRERREAGLCPHCAGTLDTERTRCSKCLEKHRGNNKRSYGKRKAKAVTA